MNEYTSIYLRDIYKAERLAMRKAVESADEEGGTESAVRLVAAMSGIRLMVSEIEDFMMQEEAAKNDT